MADPKAERVGKQIGPYRLTRLLGVGGYGEVYEAEHRLLKQTRAIKLLLERHFHDPKQHERFLREARTLASLEHPNIVPVLEVDEAGAMLYLVMPLYQRGSLDDLLKQRATPLPLAEVEHYLTQVCAALSYAHDRGIAHLDLKPENLLLHDDGRLVLADFGLAHLLKQGRLEAGSSASWGTPYYMAPEQIQGNPEPRTDLYALGVILYEVLTMQRPFTGTTPAAVMMKHLLEAPPALQAAYPAAPAALEPVIQKALAKQPADRYPTAEALLADFRSACRPATPSVQPPTPAATSAAPTPQMTGAALVAQALVTAPLNKPQTAPAVCEMQLNDGRTCGMPPVGRCATCGHGFCASHQAWRDQAFYFDQCASCLAKTLAAERDEAERQAPEEYFMSGAARTALRTSGVPSVEIYAITRRWQSRKGFFRRSGYVNVATSFGRGWILSEFKWHYTRHWTNGASDEVDENWLTALLDVSLEDFALGFSRFSNGPLVRVRPYAKGYEYVGYMRNEYFGGDGKAGRWEHWRDAMQTVKRLTGGSS